MELGVGGSGLGPRASGFRLRDSDWGFAMRDSDLISDQRLAISD